MPVNHSFGRSPSCFFALSGAENGGIEAPRGSWPYGNASTDTPTPDAHHRPGRGALKYLVFFLALIGGVPVLAGFAAAGQRYRGWLLSGLLFALCLGTSGKINFVSMESYRGPDRGFEITLADLLALALFLSMLLKDISRIRWFPRNTFPFFLYFGWSVISFLVAPQKIYAGFTLFKFFRMGFLYFVLYNAFTLDDPLPATWRGFVAIGLFITMIGLRQKYLQGIYRIPGPFDHSNTIPLFLNLILPCLVVWALGDPKMSSGRWGLTLAAAFGMLFCILATFSRAGAALAIANLLAATAMAIWRIRSPRAIGIGLLVLLLMCAGVVKVADSFLNRIRNAPKASEEARHEFNLAADHMARDHVFGVGLNQFSYMLTHDETYREYIKIMANEEQAGVCHHIYRLTAAEQGKTGLILFVILLLRTAWVAFRGFRKRTGVPGLLCFGVLLGFGSLHASGFLEWAFRITSVMAMFITVCAFAAALADQPDEDEGSGPADGLEPGEEPVSPDQVGNAAC